MKISFIKTSNEWSASMRYRILIPMKGLADLGHEVELIEHLPTETDAMIFGKHFNMSRDRELAFAAKTAGLKVIFDICDNHYHTRYEGYYREMTNLADTVTCNTPVMQSVILKETGVKSKVIDDPYEFEKKEPVFNFDGRCLKILWYGHSTNLNTLPALLTALDNLDIPSTLTVLSNKRVKITEPMEKVSFQCEPWSMNNMREYLEWADIVAVPTILSDQTKQTKSHNRVTEAIMSGKMVVAHPLPSYNRYSSYVWVGNDLTKGINWCMNDPQSNLALLKQGQKFIEATLAPDKIAARWETVINELNCR
jgi:hypothetical protein